MAHNHILIVEDDNDLRETLADFLQNEGFNISIAKNGQEGLDKLRSPDFVAPCLILLDLMMPVKDGYDFRREQLADKALAEISTVVMTAAPYSKGTEKLLNIPDLIRKPIEIDHLLQLVNKFCSPKIEI